LYVEGLRDITVYGKGWSDFPGDVKKGNPTKAPREKGHNIDLIKDFTFNLVIENCDADGYVSEKIYDSLVAGAIPLYYGNNNSRVDIPTDLYIDISKFRDGKVLQKYLDSLSDTEIANFQQRITEARSTLLTKVSQEAFRQRVGRVVQYGKRIKRARHSQRLGASELVLQHLLDLFGNPPFLRASVEGRVVEDCWFEPNGHIVFCPNGFSEYDIAEQTLQYASDGGLLIVANTNPITEADVEEFNLGDTYKYIVQMCQKYTLNIKTVDIGWGVSILSFEGDVTFGSDQPVQSNISFTDFNKHRNQLLNLVSVSEFKKEFTRSTDVSGIQEYQNTRVKLISYADSKHLQTAQRFTQEADTLDCFRNIHIYHPDDLPTDISEQFSETLQQERGAGLWIWKPIIINQALSEMDWDDYLVYADIGCTFQATGLNRFQQYLSMLDGDPKRFGCLGFQQGKQSEFEWTNPAVLNHFGIDPNSTDARSGQLSSAIILFKKTSHCVNLVKQWCDTLRENPDLFLGKTDPPPPKEHKYDQSIFSVIRKKNGSIHLPDETQPIGDQKPDHIPILATRTGDNNRAFSYL
jgi:hypothetical protein